MLRRAPSVGPSSGYQRWWGGEAGACTESLGSESGDVACCDADEIDHFFPPLPPASAGGGGPDDAPLCGAEEEEDEEESPVEAAAAPEKRRRGAAAGAFPPPMPRATGALFLRAERRAGRLILTEVHAHERGRRVVFRAQRYGGRLRLRFANDEDDEHAAQDAAGGGGGTKAGGGGSGAGGGGGAGELCQVAAGNAAGRMGVDVGAVMMGTTI